MLKALSRWDFTSLTKIKKAAVSIQSYSHSTSLIVVNIIANEDILNMMEIMDTADTIHDALSNTNTSLMWGAQADNELLDIYKFFIWARG